LIENGTVVALVYADAGFMSYSSGVYSGCPAFGNAFASINHAVEIVGMTVDNDIIIKNSWGTTWGDSGYATISGANDCALTGYVFAYNWEYKLFSLMVVLIMSLMF
jgi:C1A family cysteine protease